MTGARPGGRGAAPAAVKRPASARIPERGVIAISAGLLKAALYMRVGSRQASAVASFRGQSPAEIRRSVNRRIHIQHVLLSLEPGGLENGVVNVINGLDEGRFHSSVTCLKRSGPFAARIKR